MPFSLHRQASFFFGIIFVINIVLLLKKIGYEKIIRIGSGFVIVCRH